MPTPICRAAYNAVKDLPSLEEDPRGWFQLVDADGSGRLSRQELYEVFAATLDVDLDCLDELISKRWAEWDGGNTVSCTRRAPPTRTGAGTCVHLPLVLKFRVLGRATSPRLR